MNYLLGSLVSTMLLVPVAWGQQLHGALSLTSEAGYLTNAYLDPSFPVWERTSRAPFIGLQPIARLSWTDDRNHVMVEGSGQYTLFPATATHWWRGQGRLRLQHALSNRWRVGLQGAGSRMHTTFGQQFLWGAPYVRWNVTPQLHLGLRAGGTVQYYDIAEGQSESVWMSSPFVMIESGLWRRPWSAQGSIYYSQTTETGTSSLGLTLQASRRVTSTMRLGMQAGTDRYGYAGASGESTLPARSDRLWHAATNLHWTPHDRWTLSAQLGLQHYQTSTSFQDPNDVYASLGVTYQWQSQRSLRKKPKPLWVQEANQVRLQIPYDGGEQLYLVGDFNNWQQKDIPLHEASGAFYTAKLALKPGTYQYRVQIVEDNGETRWLSFPEHALTVNDGYGSENGVIYVN